MEKTKTISRSNPAELDKSLFVGIIYTKRVDNSATVTKLLNSRLEIEHAGIWNFYSLPVTIHKIVKKHFIRLAETQINNKRIYSCFNKPVFFMEQAQGFFCN